MLASLVCQGHGLAQRLGRDRQGGRVRPALLKALTLCLQQAVDLRLDRVVGVPFITQAVGQAGVALALRIDQQAQKGPALDGIIKALAELLVQRGE